MSAPVEQAAAALLGSLVAAGDVVLRLTEVEAYGGADDPASHAWRGRTTRNAIMFGPAGFAYVYRSYGIHWCLNVVAGPDGDPAAVLLRAGEVVDGMGSAVARRPAARQRHELANGPGRLAQALGVTGEHNGLDLLHSAAPLHLVVDPAPRTAPVASGPRVGVSRGADVSWRYWLRDDPSVSVYRRSPRAPKAAGSGGGDCCHEHRSPG